MSERTVGEIRTGAEIITQGRHSIGDDGDRLRFTATARRHRLVDADDMPLGDAWTYSYVCDPIDAERPLLFLFNGGPGCSSAWLHLSGLGPWSARVPVDLTAAPSAAAVPEESRDSILDVADLVFIDPLGTGFSRRHPDVSVCRVLGADRDAALTAQIIQSWIQQEGRWQSRVYLLGESYGTIRAALTATSLRDAGGPAVSGIAMLGQCLNAQETTQRPGNTGGYSAALPFLAACAWYHGRSGHAELSLDELTRFAHDFAIGPYTMALTADRWPDDVVEELARLTGLPTQALRARRMRVDKEDFRRLLLSDRGKTLGLTDARYVVDAPRPSRIEPEVDAAASRIDPAIFAATRMLLAQRFGFHDTSRYRFAFDAHETWDYLEASESGRLGGSTRPSPFATFDYPAHLAAALRANRDARLFFGTGHFDSLTTVGSLEHLLAQYGLPRDRVTDRRYASGHMMYTDPGERSALAGDLSAFLQP